jgi:hypothetical protein
MRDRVKSGSRPGCKAITAVLRHPRHKSMLRYLEYLKSDSQPITEEERQTYRPPLMHWWLGEKSQAFYALMQRREDAED